jgi:hypothetical protein
MADDLVPQEPYGLNKEWSSSVPNPSGRLIRGKPKIFLDHDRVPSQSPAPIQERPLERMTHLSLRPLIEYNEFHQMSMGFIV